MNILNIELSKNLLKKHYQSGLLKLLRVGYNEFFAYISTLGGGLTNKESYDLKISLEKSKAELYSQSSQKIYEGYSKIKTTINLSDNSTLVYQNDPNIFYANSHLSTNTSIFLDKSSKIFYTDGGYAGYSKGDFKLSSILRIFINSKLALNDVFNYDKNLSAFYNYLYFYNVLIYGKNYDVFLDEANLKVCSNNINDVNIIRIIANHNDLAMDYINELRNEFLRS